MQRKITSALIAWQQAGCRKPLVIYGARQVGKSYAVLDFAAHHFARAVEINFEQDESFVGAFAASLRPSDIIEWLSGRLDTKIDESTLIFFDEIQKCPRALTSLKYFAEEAKRGQSHYKIIAAGSLLGVAFGDKNPAAAAYPVGQVDRLTVYPLDFEEFLWAKGEKFLATQIRLSFVSGQSLQENLHARAENLYRTYLVVGGMPEVVQTYLEGGDYRLTQSRIISDYQEDIVKYLDFKPDRQKVLRLLENVPEQLGRLQENRRFLYSSVEPNATAKKYRDATGWLVKAGLIIPCLLTHTGDAPLTLAPESSGRKLYLHDTGLLCNRLGVTLANLDTFEQKYLGVISENYVACALYSQKQPRSSALYFWQNDPDKGSAEVDFIFTTPRGNVPLEVKFSHNTKAKSLQVFLEKYHPPLAYRISSKNFGFDPQKRLKSIPHYAVFCIRAVV